MQYVLDSIGNAGGVQTFGIMTINSLVFPTSVEPNTPFNITYIATNTSPSAQMAFGYIFDFGSQGQVSGSYWEASIPASPSGTHQVTVTFPSGISTTFSGEVRVGHMEGGGCTGPVGANGEFICGDIAYANAPTIGHRYQCTSDIWHDLGADQTNCPVGGCTNGSQQCINGYINNCTGGVWVPTATKCGGGGINTMLIMGALAAVVVVGVVFMVVKK